MVIYVDGKQIEVPDGQVKIYDPFPPKKEKVEEKKEEENPVR